jgi:membrane-associated PAP2 superfamily phosphatase
VGRRDAAWTLAALLLLLAWEASGADLAVSHLFAGPQGFAWRDAPPLRAAHDGGRVLAWALLALLAVDTFRPFTRNGPPRGERLFWLAVVLATAVLVPGIKRLSSTSCPWDLAPFGSGAAHVPYVPHWLLAVADGGPGHCFPSGHAVAVLAFVGLYFLWRGHRPRLARALAWAVWALAAVYGTVQVLRGAHFVSHVLWSAWLCWAIAAGAAALLHWRGISRRTGRRPLAAPVASDPGASRPLPWPRARAGCAEDSPAG